MRIRFTIPVANLGNTVLSIGLLFFCLFNVYLSLLFAISGQVETTESTANALIEEFRSGKPTTYVNASVEILRKTNATNATAFATPPPSSSSECIPFHSASDFQPTTKYKDSTRLPLWMKEYFDWHRAQISTINSCNFRDSQYLILRCSDRDRKCGGVADRLKSIPLYIALAARWKRVFLIRWQRPTKLEEFLLPHEVHWSFPDWLYQDDRFHSIMQVSGRRLVQTLETTNQTFVEGYLQNFYGGSSTYYRFDAFMDANKTYDEEYAKEADDLAGWSDYEWLFRDLFYTLFEPAPPVAKLVRDRMVSGNLVPGRFSTSHYRAFYAVEHEKDVVTEIELKQKTRNAIYCATQRQPGDPIYFASDSHLAVLYARNISESRAKADNNNNTNTNSTATIVTFEDSEMEALHLDKKDQWKSGKVADFYPTFVDLLIMAESKCMSFGMGGYGLFANLLSHDPNCLIRHHAKAGGKSEKCQWTDPGSEALW